MTTIRQLRSDLKKLQVKENDLKYREKEIAGKLRELRSRKAALENQIQNRCKHTSCSFTSDADYDTLGKHNGYTYYKYCDRCGLCIDSKYCHGYSTLTEVKKSFGW